MRKLFLFMMVSLDGYFEGEGHDLSWHNAKNEEFKRLVKAQNVRTDAILMGHNTYRLMASYWSAPMGMKDDPQTARFMTATPKFVAARRPFAPGWKNVTVLDGNATAKVKALKRTKGGDIAMFGSNKLCVGLMAAGLVDECRLMVNPVALGGGTPLFDGIKKPPRFKLAGCRTYRSGNVMLTYRTK